MRLARCGRDRLAECQRIAAVRFVVGTGCFQLRRPGLFIPVEELAAQVAARCIGHGLYPVLDGNGLAVMAVEIQVGCLAVSVRAEQGVLHADYFRAFFVDGHRVEVTDLHVVVRAHGVGHRPGILGELHPAQHRDILNPLHVGGVHVGAERLVAEHGQAFFQGKLEPVAAGDTVAGPVVKIFVGDHALDALEICVGGGFLMRQNKGGVEDVERGVFHRAHVEVADSDNVEAVKFVFPAVNVLVPFHRTLEGIHRPGALFLIAFADVNPQQDFAL